MVSTVRRTRSGVVRQSLLPDGRELVQAHHPVAVRRPVEGDDGAQAWQVGAVLAQLGDLAVVLGERDHRTRVREDVRHVIGVRGRVDRRGRRARAEHGEVGQRPVDPGGGDQRDPLLGPDAEVEQAGREGLDPLTGLPPGGRLPAVADRPTVGLPVRGRGDAVEEHPPHRGRTVGQGVSTAPRHGPDRNASSGAFTQECRPGTCRNAPPVGFHRRARRSRPVEAPHRAHCVGWSGSGSAAGSMPRTWSTHSCRRRPPSPSSYHVTAASVTSPRRRCASGGRRTGWDRTYAGRGRGARHRRTRGSAWSPPGAGRPFARDLRRDKSMARLGLERYGYTTAELAWRPLSESAGAGGEVAAHGVVEVGRDVGLLVEHPLQPWCGDPADHETRRRRSRRAPAGRSPSRRRPLRRMPSLTTRR